MYINILFILLGTALALLFWIRLKINRFTIDGYKSVPFVRHSWPLVGHGLQFSKDMIGFMQNCRKEYGDVFQIKIFRKNMCLVYDKNLVKEFFSKKEHEMSMYENLKSIYFDYAFSDDGSKLEQVIDIMNKTVAVKFDEFLPKIIEEATTMTHDLHGSMLLMPMTIKFVSRTSAKCFLGISMTDEMSKSLNEFTELLNTVTSLTYFLPKWLIRYTIGIQLTNSRKKFGAIICPFVHEYRQDPAKTESLLLRHCVDRIPQLNDAEICDAVLCLLYVSSENTALVLNASLVDLIKNPLHMEMLRAEIFQNDTPEKLRNMIHNQNNLLNNCVLESARLNSHLFAITRSTNKFSTLGDYYLGDVDNVVLCEPLLMAYESAASTFEDPTKYNPNRYIKNSASRKPEKLITWGAGSHLCPGKLFALYEIKMAIVAILKKYDLSAKHIPPLNYFSPSAFSDFIDLHVLIEPIISKKHKLTMQKVGDGILLREYLDEQQQIELYAELTQVSKNSIEHIEILQESQHRAFPICMWNNVYTNESNCSEPVKILDLGAKIIQSMRENNIEIGLHQVNSVYGQLFGATGHMSNHYNKHVDWGISINLGASAVFVFGEKKIVLNSGDIFVGNFATNMHGIESILQNVPQWYKNSVNYGRTRCSIQLRDVSAVNIDKISTADFKKVLKSY